MSFYLIFQKVKLQKADFWYLLWLGILLLSSFRGIDPANSILGGSYRHQGVLFFLTLYLAWKTCGILKTSQKKLLGKTIALSVFIELVLVLFKGALGTLGEVNAVSGFLAMGAVFVVESFGDKPLPFLIIPILLLRSRAAILAILPLVFSKFSKILPVLFIILVGVISLGKISSKFENRLTFWKMAVQAIAERPVLGYGAESNEKVYEEAFKKAEMPLYDFIVDRSHNLFLDVALWTGIPGLIAFCLFLLNTRKSKAILYPFLIYSFFQPLSVVHWLLLFTYLGNAEENDGRQQ